ncbi:uncharacterized protein [Miscanthus floridulus]|uniref:uncharacterized protein n=1 Tax=Miscanthus floridulus TaxID=154761 RepID=UPI00345ABD2E
MDPWRDTEGERSDRWTNKTVAARFSGRLTHEHASPPGLARSPAPVFLPGPPIRHLLWRRLIGIRSEESAAAGLLSFPTAQELRSGAAPLEMMASSQEKAMSGVLWNAAALLDEMQLMGETQGAKKMINSELWHACAGPLVCLPQRGSLVYYFPRGTATPRPAPSTASSRAKRSRSSVSLSQHSSINSVPSMNSKISVQSNTLLVPNGKMGSQRSPI